MNSEQLEICAKPFNDSEIEWISKGEKDRPKAYVAAPAVIKRLWEAFPEGWDWVVEIVSLSPTYASVMGRINAGG